MSCTRYRSFLWMIFFCVSFAIFISDLSAQKPKRINAPADTSTWAFHESGRIFAAVKSKNSVIEYDINGKEVRTFKVDPEPTVMTIKGNRLIVACQKIATVSVIDLKDNKIVGRVALERDELIAMFCSKTNNDFVYGVSKANQIVQINLSEMRVRNSVRAFHLHEYDRDVRFAMSPDGKWVVGNNRSRLSFWEADESKGLFSEVSSRSSHGCTIQAGPANRYWSCGAILYSLDMGKKVRSFTGTSMAVHPEYDLVVTFTSKGLVFQRFSDSKFLKRIPTKITLSKAPGRNYTDLQLCFTSEGSRVVVALGRDCRVIDLKEAKVPLNPFLTMKMPKSVDLKIGEQMTVPILLTNKKLLAQVEFELKKGPAGAKIIGNKLVWTPTAEQLGPHSVELIAKLGDTIDKASINLNVQSKKITLDFYITSIDVDSEGKYAVAWGIKATKNDKKSHVFSKNPDKNEVAVIDLESQTVLVQKSFVPGVHAAVIQQPYVFLLQKSRNFMCRFNAKTLDGKKRVFLKGKPWSIKKQGTKKQIAVTTVNNHQRRRALIDPETMKNSAKQAHENTNSRLVESSKSYSIFKFNIAPVTPKPALQASKEYSSKMFGRHLAHDRIISATGLTISRNTDRDRLFFSSPHHPIAFAIRMEGHYSLKTHLEIVSLVDGEMLHSQLVDVSQKEWGVNKDRMRIFPFKNKLVTFSRDDLFVIPIDLSVIESAPKPLHFTPTKLPILSIEHPQTISFKANGGAGKLEYKLIAKYEGIEVDSTSGDVTINAPLIWKNYLKKNVLTGGRISQHGHSYPEMTPENHRAFFEKALPENKLAFTLPIQLRVTDEESQEDQVTVYAVVHVEKPKAASGEIEAKKEITENMNVLFKRFELQAQRIEAKLDSALKRIEEMKDAQNSK